MFNEKFFRKNLDRIKSKIIKKDPVFFISTNFINLGLTKFEIEKITEILFKELSKLNNSTILVPTATLHLLDTKETFDKKKTKSSRMGYFSEYVRKKKNSVRSNHPLWSFSGIGKNSKKILDNVPSNCYGKNSVFDRLLNFNVYYICLGDIRKSISPIHYVEQMVGVPYRFFKEFKIKIKNKNKIKKEIYYFYSMLDDLKIRKDYNHKCIKKLLKNKTIKVFNSNNFDIYFSIYNKLIENLFEVFNKNPKIFLKNENIKFNKDLKF